MIRERAVAVPAALLAFALALSLAGCFPKLGAPAAGPEPVNVNETPV
jgi:hypothetical protein